MTLLISYYCDSTANKAKQDKEDTSTQIWTDSVIPLCMLIIRDLDHQN
jgi:hypothetical protein